jgi:hypothetical protein
LSALDPSAKIEEEKGEEAAPQRVLTRSDSTFNSILSKSALSQEVQAACKKTFGITSSTEVVLNRFSCVYPSIPHRTELT